MRSNIRADGDTCVNDSRARAERQQEEHQATLRRAPPRCSSTELGPEEARELRSSESKATAEQKKGDSRAGAERQQEEHKETLRRAPPRSSSTELEPEDTRELPSNTTNT